MPMLEDVQAAFDEIAPKRWASCFEQDPVITADQTGAFVVVNYVIAGPTRRREITQRLPMAASAQATAERIWITIQADVQQHLA